MRRRHLRSCVLAAALWGAACGREPTPAPAAARPSILLVTLDTTRADAVGPETTPALDALAARGARFRQAYAAAPETLPSHASILTGLYPAGHGVHENARVVPSGHALAAEELQRAGYRTAAFVSSFVLARRFGLARGFDVYDDALPDGRSERAAAVTTDRALAYLATAETAPRFVWVHYFDAHAPYEPDEPYRARFAGRPYLGEVAAVDAALARLLDAFEKGAAGPTAIVVVADHGEGLGDHGEAQHGTLAYQSTMHVPLVLVGPGVAPGVVDAPVSTRRVFHTILDWAGRDPAHSLRGADAGEVVLGEAMKPFLSYGWQPQVMAVAGRHKTLRAGRDETYDVVADPGETRDLGEAAVARPVRDALRDYPLPSLAPRREAPLDDEARRRLAGLGYVSAGAAPAVRRDAPRPADMARLFDVIDRASGLFVREQYAAVLPLLQHVLREDPGNLDAALRLATAHSALGHASAAEAAFERARALAPDSGDVGAYLGLHYARGTQWARAVPLLERAAEEFPDRVPVLEALATVREREGRIPEALALRQRVAALRAPGPEELLRIGRLAMAAQQTAAALEAFERARAARPDAFGSDLELGVLYLAARRLPEARDALDRVPAAHPEYPLALFKRAQVSVLLREPDAAARIEAARKRADATTRPLIARERLFATP
jgi:arylsulfatase A-like enzyme/Tfp pilus assembly protein PilF